MKAWVAAAIVVSIAAPAAAGEPLYSSPIDLTIELGGGARVVDGDTFRVGRSTKPKGPLFRLRGIAAPNKGKPGFEAAAEALRVILAGARRLDCDIVDVDKYRRPVVICFVGRVSVGIGPEMIRRGFARADARYGSDYAILEERARLLRAGLWACAEPAPAAWEKIKRAWCRRPAAGGEGG